jgi:hypothetical protein
MGGLQMGVTHVTNGNFIPHDWQGSSHGVMVTIPTLPMTNAPFEELEAGRKIQFATERDQRIVNCQ